MKTDLEDLFTLPKLDFLEQELQEQEQKFEKQFSEFFADEDITEFEEIDFITEDFEFPKFEPLPLALFEPVEFPTFEPVDWAKLFEPIDWGELFEPVDWEKLFEPIDWGKFS